MNTTICITIPSAAEMYKIGYAISLALNPDLGYVSNFGSEFRLDDGGNLIRPDVYTTFDFPCSSDFAAKARYLISHPAALHAAMSADYAARWPDLTPPTLAECEAFCAGASLSSPITDTPTT